MSFKFSKTSIERLNTCDPRLIEVMNKVIESIDFTVIEGHRPPENQAALFASGASKVKVSKHNSFPSQAIDIAPYPIDWDDLKRFIFLAGHVMQAATECGVKLRWGGNWDGDEIIIDDQRFQDLVHFEIQPD